MSRKYRRHGRKKRQECSLKMMLIKYKGKTCTFVEPGTGITHIGRCTDVVKDGKTLKCEIKDVKGRATTHYYIPCGRVLVS